MRDKKDPTAITTFKIPMKDKAKRNPLNYRSKENLKRVHQVREVTPEEQQERQIRGIREVLGNG